MPISGSLIPFLVLLKSVLIFHPWGFYGTEKKNPMDTILFFKYKCSLNVQSKGGGVVTLWTNACRPSLTADSRKMNRRTLKGFHSCGSVLPGAQVRTFHVGSDV